MISLLFFSLRCVLGWVWDQVKKENQTKLKHTRSLKYEHLVILFCIMKQLRENCFHILPLPAALEVDFQWEYLMEGRNARLQEGNCGMPSSDATPLSETCNCLNDVGCSLFCSFGVHHTEVRTLSLKQIKGKHTTEITNTINFPDS